MSSKYLKFSILTIKQHLNKNSLGYKVDQPINIQTKLKPKYVFTVYLTQKSVHFDSIILVELLWTFTTLKNEEPYNDRNLSVSSGENLKRSKELPKLKHAQSHTLFCESKH